MKHHRAGRAVGHDPLSMFVVAEQYWHGSEWLARAVDRGYPFNVDMPIVICSAFSLELYLKCLIALSGKRAQGGHDLEELFNELSPTTKTEIRARWDRSYGEDDRIAIEGIYATKGVRLPTIDFDFILTASRATFKEERYIHESGLKAGKGWCAYSIVEIVRNIIMETHPHWVDAYQLSPAVHRATRPRAPRAYPE
jgi:hypothetical protein